MKKTISSILLLALVLMLFTAPLGMKASAAGSDLWTDQVTLKITTADNQADTVGDDCSWFTRNTTLPQFYITSAKQFASVAKLVNEGYYKPCTEAEYNSYDGEKTKTGSSLNTQYYIHVYPDFAGITLQLNVGLDMGAHLWVPIGTEAHPFRGNILGIYNGTLKQYPKLINMTVTTASAADGKYYGLLGCVDSEKNKEAGVNCLTISGSIEIAGSGDAYAGAIAGKITGVETKLSNLTSSVNITSTTTGNVVIGGLVGDALKAKIQSSANKGTLDISGANQADVGGIFGIARNATFLADGSVGTTGNEPEPAGADYTNIIVSAKTANVGGIIGRLPGENDNTLSVTSITTSGTAESQENPINDDASYLVSLGDVSVTASTTANVGGFVGRSDIAFTMDKASFIRNLTVTGDGNASVGGILGGQYGDGTTTLTNCNFTTAILLRDNTEQHNVILDKTFNEAKISVDMAGNSDVGGLVGYADKLAVEAPYVGSEKDNSAGKIDIEASSTSAKTGSVGGIAGYVKSGAIATTEENAAKTLRLTVTAENLTNVGGFLGDATLTKDFFAACTDGTDAQDVTVNAESCANIGGFIGKIETTETTGKLILTANDTLVTAENSVKSAAIGGAVGLLVKSGDVSLTANGITVTVNDPAESAAIGGAVGLLKKSGNLTLTANTVSVDAQNAALSACKVGGAIGENQVSGILTVTDGEDDTATAVSVNCVESCAQANIGGFIGLNKQKFTDESLLVSDTVTKITVSGRESAVGGVIGQNEAILDGEWVRTDSEALILANDITITTNMTSSNIGGVIGYQKTGSVSGVKAENVKIVAKKGVSTTDIQNRVGGLVGLAEQKFSDVSLDKLTIEVDGNENIVGGVVGEYSPANTPENSPSNVTILDSNIINRAISSCIGGFAGLNTVTIENLSTADGLTIQLMKSEDNTVGGLVGKNTGTLYAVTTSAQITTPNTTAKEISGFRVGGLVGENTGTVQNSSRETDITFTGTATATARSVLGGLVGLNSGKVEASFSSCNLSAGAMGNVYVGGLVGEMKSGTVQNCYTAADRTLTATADSTRLGGFFGWYTTGTVTNCYSAMEAVGAAADRTGGFFACYDNADRTVGNLESCFFVQKEGGVNSGIKAAADGKYMEFTQYPDSLRTITPEQLSDNGANRFSRLVAGLWDFENVWRFDTLGETQVGYIYPLLRIQREQDSETGRMNLNWYTGHDPETEIGYHLKTEADMAGFAALVNGYVMGLNAVDFAGETVYLDNPISLQTADWNAVGDNAEFPFAGTFDGQNFLISGLRDTAEDAAGLFGYTTSDAAIQNIVLNVFNVKSTDGAAAGLVANNGGSIQDVVITLADGAAIQGKTHAGAVAGWSGGSIENVTVNGAKATISADYAGGIVGETTAELIGAFSVETTVEGKKAAGGIAGKGTDIEATTAAFIGTVSGADYVGGIAGNLSGGITADSLTVTAEGGITAESYSTGKGYTGGIAGNAGAVIDADTITVTADITGGTYVGGIVGSGKAIETVTATVTGDIEGTDYVGGIAGKLSAGIAADSLTVTAENGITSASYSTGKGYTGGIAGEAGEAIAVETIITVQADITGGTYVGGIVGSGKAIEATTATVTGDIEGTDYVGGIAGKLSAGIAADSLTVTAENGITSAGYSTGKGYTGGIAGEAGAAIAVETIITVEADITGGTYVGGIVGSGASIEVPTATVTGDIEGADYVGGIAGKLSAGITAESLTVTAENGITSAGYSTGKGYTGGIAGEAGEAIAVETIITVQADITGGTYVGGIVGSGASIDVPTATVTGDISGKDFVGGIAGNLTDSITAESLTVTAENGITGTDFVGGIAGNAGDTIEAETITVEANLTGTDYVGGVLGGGMSVSATTVEITGDILGGEKVGGITGCGTTVTVTDATITGNVTTTTAGAALGGIMGDGEAIEVETAVVTGDISGTDYVGGIAGKLSAGITAGSLTVTAENGITGTKYVGGIAGKAVEAIDVENGITVQADITGGTYVGGVLGNGTAVEADTVEITGNITGKDYVGGITGCGTTTTVTNATITGNLTTTTAGAALGGIMGDGEAIEVTTAVVTGDISGTDYVGGIAGKLSAGITADSLTVTAANGISGKEYVGGIAGNTGDVIDVQTIQVNANIKGETNVGGVLGGGAAVEAETVEITGNIDGNNNVGGVVGIGTTVTITNATVIGNVTAGSGTTYAGGIMGKGTSVTVTTAVVTGDINGAVYVGGVAGLIDTVSDTTLTFTGTITGTTNVGGVVGNAAAVSGTTATITGDVTGEDYVGGIAGKIDTVSDTALTYTGTISGTKYTGGAVGYLEQAIEQVTLTGVDTAKVVGKEYAGGAVGYYETAAQTGTVTLTKLSVKDFTVSIEEKSNATYLGGLFGALKNAYLSDSKLENVAVTAAGNSAETDIGGVVGYAENSIITGISSTNGTVSAEACVDNVYAGGAVGKVSVTADADKTWLREPKEALGVYQGVDRVALSGITVSVDSGDANYLAGKSAYVGGLVGWLVRGSLYNSTVSGGTLSGKGYESLYAGGAVGKAENAYMVSNTIDCGETVENVHQLYAGGFTGEMVNTTARFDRVESENGNLLTVTENITAAKRPVIYVGGFVGNILGTTDDQIRDNYAKTDVTLLNSHLNGVVYAGGFAGMIGYDMTPVELFRCVAESNLSVRSEDEAGDPVGVESLVGGFVGQLYAGTIESSYALSNVNANVCGNIAKSGGFAGSIRENTTLENCYNIGDNVIATGESCYSGGFVGECRGKITKVYTVVANIQGNGSFVGTIIGNQHDTTVMKYAYSEGLTDQTKLEGFDFTTENRKWAYRDGMNGNLPVLTAFVSWDSDPDIAYLYQHAADDLEVQNADELGTAIALLNDSSIYELFTDGREAAAAYEVKLAADITMTDEYLWELNVPANATVNGQGFTLSNVLCELPDAAYCGFAVENAGTIQNLTLDKTKIVCATNAGAAAGHNAATGTVEQVIVMNADLSAKECVGLVVGVNDGTVHQAAAFGDYSYAPTANTFIFGGIAGKNNGTITESLNEANLKVANCVMNVGGIAGESTGTIQDCMTASGTLVSGICGSTANGNVGGIVGVLKNTGKVTDCIGLSQVILQDKDGKPLSTGRAIAGSVVSGGKITNTCYDKRLSRVGDYNATSKDTADLLGVQVVAKDAFTAQEGQYPVLTWLKDTSLGKLSGAAFHFVNGPEKAENIDSALTGFLVTCADEIIVRVGENTSVIGGRTVTLLDKEGSFILICDTLSRTVKLSNVNAEKPDDGGGSGTGGGGGGTTGGGGGGGTTGGGGGGTTGGGGGSTPTEEPPKGVSVTVGGETYNIGTETEDALSYTVTIDAEKLAEYLDSASDGSQIVIPLNSEKNVNKAVMTVGNLMDAAEKQMEMQVICGDTQITIPTDGIDTAPILENFEDQDANDIPFTVTVKVLSEPEKAELSRQTGYELVGDVVSFQITAGSGNETYVVKQFSGWTERILPAAEDAKITTGVEILNGKAIHKPTNVRTIYSLTDSVYAYIYNEASFADAAGMWYESTVNEMASRLIVNGRSADEFDGQGTITRAEFAAILIRALGLHEDGDGTVFADVNADDWYCGAVGRAYEAGLVMGRDDGRFAPDDRITRQEAMVMIERAAKLLALEGTYGTLDRFSDAELVSDWALSAAQFNVGTGLIQGDDTLKLHPADSITRAESATVILRLLRTAGWVDVR